MVTDLVSNCQVPDFMRSVRRRATERRSWLCVGLDPDLHKMPATIPRTPDGLRQFCREVVAATAGFCACFKINFAFFEALGAEGWRVLERVRQDLPGDLPVIADAKRGDIPSTMQAYARSIFDELAFDAVTLSPFLGWDSLAPFLEYPGRAVFVLCRTSNSGSEYLQEMIVDGEPIYRRVARDALQQRSNGQVGVVVGATYPHALREVRALSDEMPILIPGVGAQGATACEAVTCGSNDRGENGIVNVSRSVLYASSDADFASVAASMAERTAAETWLPGSV